MRCNLAYSENKETSYIVVSREPMTLEEIAIRFGIGAERVRQIQNEALNKIRENYSENLKGLL